MASKARNKRRQFEWYSQCAYVVAAVTSDGVRPPEAPDLPRRQARELSHWAAGEQKTTHHLHHRLWPCEGVHRPRDAQAHTLSGTQESDRHCTLHEHPHASWQR